MTTYITQKQAEAFAHRRATKYAHRTAPLYCSYAFVPHTLMDFVRDIEAAAIQHYRDSLVAGVVLPELPESDKLTSNAAVPWHSDELIKDYARQAVADALAKQVPQDLHIAPSYPKGSGNDPAYSIQDLREAYLRGSKQSRMEKLIDKSRVELVQEISVLEQQLKSVKQAPQINESAAFTAQHKFLEWNRKEEKPLVSVAYEYGVFRKAIELYIAAAPDQKDGT